MLRGKIVRPVGVVVLLAGLLASSAVVHATPGPGTVLASAKVKSEMLKDFNITEPARCFAPELARSDRRWATFSPALPSPPGCTPYDGAGVVRKVSGTWMSVPGVSGGRDCASVKRVLIGTHKAPRSVYRDFKAAGYCS